MTAPQPDKPLVLYRFYDDEDDLLYIGITNNPRARYSQHGSDKRWFKRVTRSTMQHYSTRAELEAAEIQAIQTEKPRYNIAHSVIPGRNQIKVTPRTTYSTSKGIFQRPDAIASSAPTRAEIEARQDEMEQQIARIPVVIPGVPCPCCDLKILTREHDGLVRCLNCLNMWAPEELEEQTP